MEDIIKMTRDAPQPETQVEIDPDLFRKFMQHIPTGIIVQLVEKVI